MYGCESWTIKKVQSWRINAFKLCCWRRFLSPLDCKEIKPMNLNRNQSWIFTAKTHAEAEAPILWPPDAKVWLIGKDPDAGKDYGQEEKGTTENEIVGWHHWHNAHEFEQTPGDSEGQGGLGCCSSCGLRVGHDLVTEQQFLVLLPKDGEDEKTFNIFLWDLRKFLTK